MFSIMNIYGRKSTVIRGMTVVFSRKEKGGRKK